MSRVAKVPVIIPVGVDVRVDHKSVTVKGPKGILAQSMLSGVEILQDEGVARVLPRVGEANAKAFSGTARALLNNMVIGVSQGFEKRLELVGVGYRAQVKDKILNLALGYSHPIDFPVPEGIVLETPTNTQIVVRGIDKQRVGQTAATIRSFRPPEPYKGKGVRYVGETIIRKVAKKK
uniref:Large ribosomal subunit protein uL6 n=1 Tax=Candidatus Kentrum sp. LPFa TaxID=2126335 RepID=A0A450VXF2_9GAMM|nr:MAG: large subunit ribosomal protein L6 [Candidatus Kentron sp. LPFa]VFK25496.1 MAG: large subunit ribosomal protein L6 [Candidatus Kentron sp. LPFa]